LALALAAQRSSSARTASSGPTALPKPRQADKQTDRYAFLVVSSFSGPECSLDNIITQTRAIAINQHQSNTMFESQDSETLLVPAHQQPTTSPEPAPLAVAATTTTTTATSSRASGTACSFPTSPTLCTNSWHQEAPDDFVPICVPTDVEEDPVPADLQEGPQSEVNADDETQMTQIGGHHNEYDETHIQMEVCAKEVCAKRPSTGENVNNETHKENVCAGNSTSRVHENPATEDHRSHAKSEISADNEDDETQMEVCADEETQTQAIEIAEHEEQNELLTVEETAGETNQWLQQQSPEVEEMEAQEHQRAIDTVRKFVVAKKKVRGEAEDAKLAARLQEEEEQQLQKEEQQQVVLTRVTRSAASPAIRTSTRKRKQRIGDLQEPVDNSARTQTKRAKNTATKAKGSATATTKAAASKRSAAKGPLVRVSAAKASAKKSAAKTAAIKKTAAATKAVVTKTIATKANTGQTMRQNNTKHAIKGAGLARPAKSVVRGRCISPSSKSPVKIPPTKIERKIAFAAMGSCSSSPLKRTKKKELCRFTTLALSTRSGPSKASAFSSLRPVHRV
jgi:hypothetical protein